MTNKQAVIYTRVSTDEQAEHGYSLQSQLGACRDYANRHGLTIAAEYQDDHSGAKLNRPGLDLVRDMVARRAIDALIVYSPDRFTRKLAHSLILREELQQAAVELHYCNKGKLENTPEGKMQENIEAVFADYWRAKIIESSARGRRQKAANGKWPCDGHAAYGYRKEGKGREAELVIDQYETGIVRRIFELYTGIKTGKPLSLQQIAKLLTDENIPTPGRGWAAKKGNEGKGWHRAVVRRILKRESYIGKFHYGGHDIDLPHLAIIEKPLFDLAQKRLNRAKAKHNKKYEYLLSGHIQCSCGGFMGSQPQQGGKYLYYGCSIRSNSPHLTDCEESYVRANGDSGVDALVWNWLSSQLDADNVERGLKELARQKELDAEPLKQRLEAIDKIIAKTERKINGLAETIANSFGDDADKTAVAALKEQLKAAGREREALAVEREGVAAELANEELTEDDYEIIKELAAELHGLLDVPSFELKRQLAHVLGLRVKLAWKNNKRGLACTCYLTLQQTPDQNWINLSNSSLWLGLSSTTMM